jgi:hypothetical protein
VKAWTSIVVHICNLITQEAEAGRSQVQSQPRLYKEILSQEKEGGEEGKGGREVRKKKIFSKDVCSVYF